MRWDRIASCLAMATALAACQREQTADTQEVPAAPAPAAVVETPLQKPVTATTAASAPDVPRAALPYRAMLIRTARAVWGMDAPIAVFAAQIHQESGWKADAVSRVGAQGMAQFMPSTVTWIAKLDPELSSREPFNPAWAMRALVVYDQWLYDRTPQRYTAHDRMWVALRGYNGGLGHWTAEAASTGLAQPSRAQVDAACGKARRAPLHCKENLGYPQRILIVIQPRYAAWGPTV
ncbi:transglycosylase SLT domain-containing protein [Acidovorax sp. BLS4]|uniref:transglycosylase SLT domain-containing protein n=1 Tax=Acidovorax sp. BLS4 TaxID=3273430 RepID=UPI00294279BC|nr:transglycosylase SLT domain-containing protein [Paracidovorax avenae]WOI47729.1 transglycosylase SLT domain-containing protein [Paracidovorax avenae]